MNGKEEARQGWARGGGRAVASNEREQRSQREEGVETMGAIVCCGDRLNAGVRERWRVQEVMFRVNCKL